MPCMTYESDTTEKRSTTVDDLSYYNNHRKLGSYVFLLGRRIDRHSTDVSVDIIGRDVSTEMCRSTYQPMYQPRYLG